MARCSRTRIFRPRVTETIASGTIVMARRVGEIRIEKDSGLTPGTVVAGRYRIVALLASYLARSLGPTYAKGYIERDERAHPHYRRSPRDGGPAVRPRIARDCRHHRRSTRGWP